MDVNAVRWASDTPTVEMWRCLARSSPVLWDSVQFRAAAGRAWPEARSYTSRVEGQLVETLEGEFLHYEQVYQPMRPLGATSSAQMLPSATDLLPGTSGLIEHPRECLDRNQDPMFQTYLWVAMLDPRELADGAWDACESPEWDALWSSWHAGRSYEETWADPELPWALRKGNSGRMNVPGALVKEVTCVDHHGRRAWEAQVTPTVGYDPRCGCCPLIHRTEVEWAVTFDLSCATSETGHDPVPFSKEEALARESWAGSTALPGSVPHLVRLDEATGICVYVQPLLPHPAFPCTQPSPPVLIDLAIEAVDMPMPPLPRQR